MRRFILPLALLGTLAGCCLPLPSVSWSPRWCTCKPPLNCMGYAYDGSSSPCYRPLGPFWCQLPGPCSTCRDPWVGYYVDSHSRWIRRGVCDLNAESESFADGTHMMDPEQPRDGGRVYRQVSDEE